MLVAIDGPAGSGKSTVARALARRLGFTYLNSGAMYRCVALLLLAAPADEPSALARAAHIELRERVLLDGRDVTAEIRASEVTETASRVAADPGVREALVAKQRELIADGDWVAEGRDISTRRRARGGVEGIPHREPGGARSQTRDRAGRRSRHGARRAGPARRARLLACAQPTPGGAGCARAGHERADGPSRLWSTSRGSPAGPRAPSDLAPSARSPRLPAPPGHTGQMLKVAVVGYPNVGKSSLINRLTGTREAVVH